MRAAAAELGRPRGHPRDAGVDGVEVVVPTGPADARPSPGVSPSSARARPGGPGLPPLQRGHVSKLIDHLRSASPYAVGQVFSSGTNLAAGLVAARVLRLDQFAAFAFAQASLAFMQAITRAAIGEPMLIHGDPTGPGTREDDALTTAAVLAGLSVLVFLALSAVDLPLFSSFAYVAAAAPAIVLHDCLRYDAFSSDEPRVALRLDVIWALSQLVATAALFLLFDSRSVPVLLAVWVVGAFAGAASQLGRIVSGLRRGRVRRWIAVAGTSARNLTVGIAVGFAALQASNSAIAGQVGDDFLGAIRGAQLIVAPVGALGSVLIPYSVPRMRRLLDAGRSEELLAITLRLGSLLSVLMTTYVVVAWALASWVLPALVGSRYLPYRHVFLIVGIAASIQVALVATNSALRSLGATGRMMRFQVGATVLGLLLLLSASVIGEDAVLAALVAQAAVLLTLSSVALLRTLGRARG